jgi:hypothetical protein
MDNFGDIYEAVDAKFNEPDDTKVNDGKAPKLDADRTDQLKDLREDDDALISYDSEANPGNEADVDTDSDKESDIPSAEQMKDELVRYIEEAGDNLTEFYRLYKELVTPVEPDEPAGEEVPPQHEIENA